MCLRHNTSNSYLEIVERKEEKEKRKEEEKKKEKKIESK